MDTPQERFDETLMDFVDRISNLDLSDDTATTAVKNLETFSKCRPPAVEPEPTPDPVPETWQGKLAARTAAIWDNETTRVFIKAGGAFAGIALVAYSTIHKDHVIERQAMAQANQKQ